MVYRDLPSEEAQKRFAESSEAPAEAALAPVGVVVAEKKKRQRKTVKALVPK